MKTLSYHRNTV